MLFLALYQIVDGIMVGRSLGPEAMASVNVLYPLVALVSGLAVMIGTGGNARIAVLLGAGKQKEAGRVLGMIVALGIGLGALVLSRRSCSCRCCWRYWEPRACWDTTREDT